MFYECDGCVTDVYKGIMANKCIYFNYIFCKSWHEPNGFRAEIPYSWIFVLVWTDPNAILSLDAKSIRRDLFLIENWTSTRIFGTPMLRGFSPGIKAWNKNQPWVLLNSALRAELLQVAPRRGTSRLHKQSLDGGHQYGEVIARLL